jgi:hypothetical protein
MIRHTLLSLSLFACSSFDEQPNGSEPVASSFVIVEGNTTSVDESSSNDSTSSTVVFDIPELNLEIHEVEEGSIEDNETSSSLDGEDVIIDEENKLVLMKEISQNSPIVESVQEGEPKSFLAISNVPSTILAEIELDHKVSIAHDGEDSLYTSELLQALVAATKDDADIVYIPLHAENMPPILFEAIDYGTSKGVQFFDANGERL